MGKRVSGKRTKRTTSTVWGEITTTIWTKIKETEW
jgi:hypothetical protein